MEPAERSGNIPDGLRAPLRLRRHRIRLEGDKPRYRLHHIDGTVEVVEADTAYEACKKAENSSTVVRIARESSTAENLMQGERFRQSDEFVEVGFAELFSRKDKDGQESLERVVIIPAPDTISADYLTDEMASSPHGPSWSDVEGEATGAAAVSEVASQVDTTPQETVPDTVEEAAAGAGDEALAAEQVPDPAAQVSQPDAAVVEEAVMPEMAGGAEQAATEIPSDSAGEEEVELSAEQVEALLNGGGE